MKFESVTIMFAKPDAVMEGHYDMVVEAIKSAEKNLARWGISIVDISKCMNNRVTIRLAMKDHVPFNNPGHRLRGIPHYLLQKYPEIYRKMTLGARLFYYFPGVCQSVSDPKRVCLLIELAEEDDSREAIKLIRAHVRRIMKENKYRVMKIASWSKEGRISDLTEKEEEKWAR